MTALERDLALLGASSQAFEPALPEGPPAPSPAAAIERDRSLGWMRRMLPLVLARRRRLAAGLVAAAVAMLAQVVAPRVLMAAIDRGLTQRTSSLTPFVVALAVLALVRGGLTFYYRATLFKLAFALEYDLRKIGRAHV